MNKHVQSMNVSFLHWTRNLDSAIVTALNDANTTQAKTTDYAEE